MLMSEVHTSTNRSTYRPKVIEEEEDSSTICPRPAELKRAMLEARDKSIENRAVADARTRTPAVTRAVSEAPRETETRTAMLESEDQLVAWSSESPMRVPAVCWYIPIECPCNVMGCMATAALLRQSRITSEASRRMTES